MCSLGISVTHIRSIELPHSLDLTTKTEKIQELGGTRVKQIPKCPTLGTKLRDGIASLTCNGCLREKRYGTNIVSENAVSLCQMHLAARALVLHSPAIIPCYKRAKEGCEVRKSTQQKHEQDKNGKRTKRIKTGTRK